MFGRHLRYRLAGCAAAFFLAACGSGGDSGGSSETAVSAPPAQTVSDTSLQDVKNRGVLRVAIYGDRPPFSFIDEQGQAQGYDVALGKRLAKDLLGSEDKVEWVPTLAEDRIAALQSDRVDIVLANFTQTPDRAAQVDFALPYMKTSLAIASARKNMMRNAQTLIVIKGTTTQAHFSENFPSVKLVAYDTVKEAFDALASGQGGALAEDNTTIYSWINDHPDFVVSVDKIGDEAVIAPAVKQGNKQLLEWVNSEIRKLYSEKFFYRAYDETVRPFYGADINPDLVVYGG